MYTDVFADIEHGGGSGQIHYFSCYGDETRLQDCYSLLNINFCDHSEDVGVFCYFG